MLPGDTIVNPIHRRKTDEKEWKYYAAIILIVSAYLVGMHFWNIPNLSDIVTTATTLVAAVAIWLEMKQNKSLNETEFIMELNSQFVNNPDIVKVEHKLEIYYYYWKVNNEGKASDLHLDLDLDIEDSDRQDLVNYLVYLEGLAAMVRSGVIHLEAIDDLFAYRFFIAFNNPVVYEKELNEYTDYYQGCFWLHKKWTNRWHKAGRRIPLVKYDANGNPIK